VLLLRYRDQLVFVSYGGGRRRTDVQQEPLAPVQSPSGALGLLQELLPYVSWRILRVGQSGSGLCSAGRVPSGAATRRRDAPKMGEVGPYEGEAERSSFNKPTQVLDVAQMCDVLIRPAQVQKVPPAETALWFSDYTLDCS
jgi:hypothetical protein